MKASISLFVLIYVPVDIFQSCRDAFLYIPKLNQYLTRFLRILYSAISTKISYAQDISSHCRPTNKTPFKWRFAVGPIVAHSDLLTGMLCEICIRMVYFCLARTVWNFFSLSSSLFIELYNTGKRKPESDTFSFL